MWSPPFVLLDDARPGGAPARLYRDPVEIVLADTPEAVRPALDRLRAARGRGLHAAGWLAYEAGAALAPRPLPAIGAPLVWFGLFGRYELIDDVARHLPDPAGAHAAPPRALIDRDAYGASLARVQALIAAGDLYQANLTFPTLVPIAGDPLALYARLRAQARAGWGAVIATAERTILSCSPELFVALDGDRLTCRPMKGTARRGADAAEDRRLAADLATDDKQRAENLMIVDLMRNDLSRVAAPGSVAAPALFTAETYPTIHQLTSTVTATLGAGRDAIDVLAALMPCGSITGAPKLRAMEVIAEVEGAARGVYTGAIGRLDADGDAQFSVAIRTLDLPAGADKARLGLGSGIVADSRADDEWAEAHAKGAFVTAGQRPVDLIETMRFDPVEGLLLLERHLARLKHSAAALGFAFDRHAARNELQAATFRLRGDARVRLLLAASGAIAIDVAPLPAPVARWTAAVVPLPVSPADYRLRHKTSDRCFYDAARLVAGTDEVVFTAADGTLTEGSFTSLFVPGADGVLRTPPLAAGLLPGVLRAELLATGRAVEAVLHPADLAGGFLLGNALRGLVPATVAGAEQAPL